MGIWLDDQVLLLTDELLNGMVATSRRLYTRLTELGFVPKGQIPTLIYAIALFIHHYGEVRSESTIEESLEMAKAQTFANPILQRHFAEMSAGTVNGVVLRD